MYVADRINIMLEYIKLITRTVGDCFRHYWDAIECMRCHKDVASIEEEHLCELWAMMVLPPCQCIFMYTGPHADLVFECIRCILLDTPIQDW